ncbi:MAG: hypothetical protein ACPLRH_06190, partial [Desulfotomaculales bacterium]
MELPCRRNKEKKSPGKLKKHGESTGAKRKTRRKVRLGMDRGTGRRKTILIGLIGLTICFLIMVVSGCGPVATSLQERQTENSATGNAAGKEEVSLEYRPPAAEKSTSGKPEQATAGSGS